MSGWGSQLGSGLAEAELRHFREVGLPNILHSYIPFLNQEFCRVDFLSNFLSALNRTLSIGKLVLNLTKMV